jgi:hypothetical protein
VDRLLDGHIALVQERIRTLQALQQQLVALRRTCDGDALHACAILRSFMSAAQERACGCHPADMQSQRG